MPKTLNIKALRAFRLAVSEGSLQAVSEFLPLSQPAISRLISGLEYDINLKLFDRSGRHLVPTAEGLAFYEETAHILANLDEIPRIADEIRTATRRVLRIVSMPRIAQAVSAPAVAHFLRQNPQMHVSLDVRARREAAYWLVGKEYDIGIGVLPVENPKIHTVPLFRARAQAVLPAKHKLADKTKVTAVELKDELVVRLMHGLLLRGQLDDIFHSAGVTPVKVCEVAASQLACALVAENVGVTIADELVASQVQRSKLALVPIAPARWMTFGLLYPKPYKQTPMLSQFEQTLLQYAEKLCAGSTTLRAVSTK